MSQTLQSLNALLKYKQERERQKIDKSLSMMDMATRLRQQKIENARQAELMSMRRKEEDRKTTLFSKQLESAELALEKERRESSPEYLQRQKDKAEALVKKAEFEAEAAERTLKEDEMSKLNAAISSMNLSNKEKIVTNAKKFLSPIFRATKASTVDQKFEIGESSEVKEGLKKFVKDKKLRKFYEGIIDGYPSLLTGVAAYQMTFDKQGQRNDESFKPLFEALNTMYDDLVENKKLVTTFNEAGISTDELNINNELLKRQQQFENYYDSGLYQSQLLDLTNKRLKNQGLDKNSILNELMIQGLAQSGILPSDDEFNALNQMLIEEGKDALPFEDFTTNTD